MSGSLQKKILVISSYAPPAIGGPMNMYNLLRDYPADRYLILTSFYNIDDRSARSGLWLPAEYIFYDRPGAVKNKRRESALKDKMGNKLSNIVQRLRFMMKHAAVLRIIFGLPVITVQAALILCMGLKTIKKTKPDILLGFSDYGPAMLGTYFLHKLTKKPYVIFLFDLYKGNFLPFPGELLAKIFERSILENAEKIVVTNEGTLDFYKKQYGKKITEKIVVIHNSVFVESYAHKEMTPKLSDNHTPRILFTGRLYWPQVGALRNLIRAINSMGDFAPELSIYTPTPKEYLDKIGIREMGKVKIGSASPTEIPNIQKNADILFLPLSWNTRSQAIIDTATPGKLTDYLIAGKPMLIHAPASSHLVKYARENDFAAIADENSVSKLQEMIVKILDNKDFARRIVENAQKTFFANHDATKNSRIFYNLFT